MLVTRTAKQLATAPDEKTPDIHVFFTINGAIPLLVDY
jgi:hypothetical protein